MVLNEMTTQAVILQLLELLRDIDDKDKRKSNLVTIRQLFEEVTRKLTESENLTFGDLFGRYSYIADIMQVPEDMDASMHYVRKMTNKNVHSKDFQINRLPYQDIIIAFARFVSFASKLPLPDALSIELTKTYTKHPERIPTEVEPVEILRFQFKELNEKVNNGVKMYTLFGVDEENGGPITIVHSEGTGNKTVGPNLNIPGFSGEVTSSVAKSLPMLKKYRLVELINLHRSPGADGKYYTDDKTILILEPDFLVDVSSLAECFTDRNVARYEIFFTHLFKSSGTSLPAFKGSVVNGLLDALTLDPDRDPDEIVNKIFEENALQSAVVNTTGTDSIRQEIKSVHLDNIKKLLQQLQGTELTVEPTFLSPLYGLQGRLDMFVQPADAAGRRQVIELKSGKPPHGSAIWPNNMHQSLLYLLLIRSALGEEQKADAAIFYSGAPVTALRYSPEFFSSIHIQMATRNAIVAVLYGVMSGNYQIFKVLANALNNNVIRFGKDELNVFLAKYEQLTPTELAYYHTYLSFLIRELITAKTGTGADERGSSGFASLWSASVAEKQNRYAILTGLIIEKFDDETGEITFSYNAEQMHNFRPSDVVLIYRAGNDDNPVKQQILKGTFLNFDEKNVIFRLRNKQILSRFFETGTEWNMEHDLFESSSWGELAAFSAFVMQGEAYRSLIMCEAIPEYEELPFEDEPGFNPNQNELLKKAVAAKDYFLLQGPPGTGKTSKMLPAILRRLRETTEECIYILSFTNRSVDEIVTQLRKNNIDFLRIGSASVTDDEMLHNLAKGKTPEELREIIKSKPVIVSTVSSFYIKGADLMQIRGRNAANKAGICIVDEASQLTEPGLVGLLHNFSKWILIGDQNQLPAVVAQDQKFCKVADPLLNKIGVRNCTVSLFERLYRNAQYNGFTHAYGMLEQHYRMHQEIAGLINSYYGNRLIAGRDEQKSLIPADEKLMLPFNKRVVLIPTDATESSRTSRQEAERVVQCIRYLYKVHGNELKEDVVGVVTPWRAQIALIKTELAAAGLGKLPVTVDTVERFQGSEKKIILVSFALNYKTQIGALESTDVEGQVDRKLVVALSRAKDQLIMFGNPEMLNFSDAYKELLQKITDSGGSLKWEQISLGD